MLDEEAEKDPDGVVAVVDVAEQLRGDHGTAFSQVGEHPVPLR
jgi:hypothetical protein